MCVLIYHSNRTVRTANSEMVANADEWHHEVFQDGGWCLGLKRRKGLWMALRQRFRSPGGFRGAGSGSGVRVGSDVGMDGRMDPEESASS